MDQKIRCQSCGMPLQKGFFATNEDGSENREYCPFCFQNGRFTEPDLTLEQMIQKSVNYMSTKLNFSREEAEKLSRDIIPNLKRWSGI
jgi:radical SAM superfamily enzyme